MLSKTTRYRPRSFSTSKIAEAGLPGDFQPTAVPAREIKANEAHKPNVLRRRDAAAIGALISAAALTGGLSIGITSPISNGRMMHLLLRDNLR